MCSLDRIINEGSLWLSGEVLSGDINEIFEKHLFMLNVDYVSLPFQLLRRDTSPCGIECLVPPGVQTLWFESPALPGTGLPTLLCKGFL